MYFYAESIRASLVVHVIACKLAKLLTFSHSNLTQLYYRSVAIFLMLYYFTCLHHCIICNFALIQLHHPRLPLVHSPRLLSHSKYMHPNTCCCHPQSQSPGFQNESKAYYSHASKLHQSSKCSHQQNLRAKTKNLSSSSLKNMDGLRPHYHTTQVHSQGSTSQLRGHKSSDEMVTTDVITKISPRIRKGRNFKTVPRNRYIDLTVASARMVGYLALSSKTFGDYFLYFTLHLSIYMYVYIVCRVCNCMMVSSTEIHVTMYTALHTTLSRQIVLCFVSLKYNLHVHVCICMICLYDHFTMLFISTVCTAVSVYYNSTTTGL